VAVCTDLRYRHATEHAHHVRPTQEELSEVGTTAEVVAFKEEEVSYYGQCFVVKFLGRQRFRLLELHRRVNG
jgi:Lon protease-like protein